MKKNIQQSSVPQSTESRLQNLKWFIWYIYLYWEKSSSRTSQCADPVCWEFLRTSPAGLSCLRSRVEKWHLQWKGLAKCFFQFLGYSVSFCIIIFCFLNMWKCVVGFFSCWESTIKFHRLQIKILKLVQIFWPVQNQKFLWNVFSSKC